MTYKEIIHAQGHENVTGTHASTWEVTSDDFLTPAGDCILGIEADRVPADFAEGFVEACREPEAKIVATLEVDGIVEKIEGRGDPEMELANDRSLVGRTSDYLDDRTIGIEMDKAATDLDRELIAHLADGASLTVTLAVE
jgi:hypothetical protein